MNSYVIDLDEINPPRMSMHDGRVIYIITIYEPPNIFYIVREGTKIKFTADRFGKKQRFEGTVNGVLWLSGPIVELRVAVPWTED